MGTIIGWIAVLAPFFLPLLKKVLPKFFSWLGGVGGGFIISAAGKLSVLGWIVSLLAKIWGWFKRLPAWLRITFGATGILAPVRWFFLYLLKLFKTPVLLFISLVISSFFPTIIEKIFLVVGAVGLRIFLFIFKIGKNLLTASIDSISQSGGNGIDELRDSVLDSFDMLPPCTIDVLGYLHLVEDLGLIVTTASILAVISLFRLLYGRWK